MGGIARPVGLAGRRDQAVTACAFFVESTGENVLSGLVESVIGLRLP